MGVGAVNIQSTMQDDYPLSVPSVLRHASALFADALVSSVTSNGLQHVSFGEVTDRVHRLTGALEASGVARGARVGTFLWNTQAHLEAYLGIPSAGMVMHTINVRLFPDQVAAIIDSAQDEILLVDATLWKGIEPVLAQRRHVRLILVDGSLDVAAASRSVGKEVRNYDSFVAGGRPSVGEVSDERSPAAMCYTSGTTGSPKGVVYSHRSVYLHALVNLTVAGFGISDQDRILQVVPMFHANGWGFPYAALLAGADLILPGRDLSGATLASLIASERPTFSGGVPTVWRQIIDYAEQHDVDLTSLRTISCAGSAVPESLLRDYHRLGIEMFQAWGMTETSPLAAIARPPARDRGRDEWYWRTRTGRPVPGVEVRAVSEDGSVLPRDGASVGELQVRGPWVAAGYVDGQEARKFQDGWLCTGDMGTIDDAGAMKITDRLKDLIKSGGEWISSTELEGLLLSHPDVADAAVIGIPDPTWQERPLALVTPVPEKTVDEKSLRTHLESHVARWQVPDRFQQVVSIPRTAAGKIDKETLRRSYAQDSEDIFRP